MNQKGNRSTEINWGLEIFRVFKIIGKVFFRILSYLINIVLTFLLIGLITGIIVGTVFAIYINNYLDLEIDPNIIASATQDSTTRIFYEEYETIEDRKNRDGKLVEIEDQRLYATDNSISVTYSQIPKNLEYAFIAIEDKRFRTHNGFDWLRTGRAVIDFLLPTGKSGGGSTITQQLIKNATSEDDVTIQRKVQEIFRAINLEKVKSKEEILTAYLNIIYLGNGCYGVQSAANYYFNKDVSELTLVECAAFAAIVKNPYQYEPKYHDQNRILYDEDGYPLLDEDGEIKYLEGNADRRWLVLELMHQEGYITEAERDEAQQATLNIVDESELEEKEETEGIRIFSWYTESLISQLLEDFMEEYGVSKETASQMIYQNGYSIVTPMDPEVQSVLEEVYTNYDQYFPSTSSGGLPPQSAMVVCEPHTNDVLGVAGGIGVKTLNRGTNRATVDTHSPGSSIKPLSVYAPAIDAGLITYGSVIDDTPVYFTSYEVAPATATTAAVIGYNPYPKNLPVVYDGLTTIKRAVTTSKNTVAMKILQMLTIDRSFDFLKNELHIDSLVESATRPNGEIVTDRGLAALSLGQLNYGLTVEEITAAYSIFANNGIYNESKLYLRVEDANGNIILSNEEEKPSIVISDETASIMTILLEKVMSEGTGTACTLRHTVDVAGKTGTTSSDFDRYFVGYTPYYVAGVWTGYDNPQSLSAFAANPSLTIWDAVMTMLHQKYIDEAKNGGEPLLKFERAPGVIESEYCRDSGKLCSDACSHDPRGYRKEIGYFTRDTVPTEECDTHILVKRDSSKNLIASPNCNPNDLVDVALVKVYRSFPMELYVTDAQYVYRELPLTVKPSGWWGIPFFQHTLAEGEYCGSSYVNTPYNAYCYFHCDYRPWGGNPPAEDSGYDPEQENNDSDIPNIDDPPNDYEDDDFNWFWPDF